MGHRATARRPTRQSGRSRRLATRGGAACGEESSCSIASSRRVRPGKMPPKSQTTAWTLGAIAQELRRNASRVPPLLSADHRQRRGETLPADHRRLEAVAPGEARHGAPTEAAR